MIIYRFKHGYDQLSAASQQMRQVDPVTVIAKQRRRFHLKLQRKTFRRRFIRYSLVALYVLILGGVAGFVLYSPQTDSTLNNQVSLLGGNTPAPVSPLDQLSAASVAVNVAQIGHLAEATAVRNQADTVNADINIVAAGDGIVSKPQVVSATLKSRKDIQTYVVQAGDAVPLLAVKFGVSSDSIKWSNGLSSDSLTVGTTLTIPPVNGFTYTVKAGDTPDNLAARYKTTAEQIIAFNDAEVGGLQSGELIVVPNGQKVVASLPIALSTFKYNGYDYGYCTYWVALRRIQVGSPLPVGLGDASKWKQNAINKYGMEAAVGSPQKGAAAVTSTSGAGHVVFVEQVYSDGSILVSEMNHLGWNKTDTRVFSADEAAGFGYIY